MSYTIEHILEHPSDFSACITCGSVVERKRNSKRCPFCESLLVFPFRWIVRKYVHKRIAEMLQDLYDRVVKYSVIDVNDELPF